MAQAITETINANGRFIAESGTGKPFAYMIPALLKARSDAIKRTSWW